MAVPVPRDRVLDIFKKANGRSLKAKDVGKGLGLSADDRSVVCTALSELADEGALVQLEGRRYALPGEQAGAHRGFVQRKPSGSAWFIPDDKSVSDAFVPPHELLGVIDGDVVLARIERAPRGPAAKIVRVLERKRNTVTGTYTDSGKAQWVDPDDNVMSGPIVIPPGTEGNGAVAASGDVVEVLIVHPPTPVTTSVGRVIRSIGKRGKLDVEIERILAEKGIVKAFPPEVDAEAATHPPNPTKEDSDGREDLRAIPLVTIDGETAKDFDDAVYGKTTGKRNADISVVVAIADVSHYVRFGQPLDVEAARRGTSIYYPGKVVPMLPEALSNGLCSLKPDVDRLCLVTEFAVRPDGTRHKHRFYTAVMKSHARLTYTKVQAYLDGDKILAASLTDVVKDSLHALDEASQRLRFQRKARGALDFDLPETVIALDDTGEPVKIHPLSRLNAHKLIEDLMVAANEAVAERFVEKRQPCVYRIHEPPNEEKLERFAKLAKMVLGRRVTELEAAKNGSVSPKNIMKVMDELKDHPAKRALDSLLLRSMMQAKYAAQNLGHYGLGSDAYLHFTSPIRRYPDLVVHRLLKERVSGRVRKKDIDEDMLLQELDAIAATSSECERTATDIERTVDALYSAWFMKDKVGEVYQGVIQGVAEFGLFVVLTDVNVEGMIRVADIGGDYWMYDDVRLRLVGERSGRQYSIGDVLRVKVAGVDVAKRQIGLVIDDANASPRPLPAHERRGARSARPNKRGRETTSPTRVEDSRYPNRKPKVPAKRPAPAAKRHGRGNDRARPRPELVTKERPKIRGPEDLRRIFEEKSTKGGRGGGNKRHR
jgi:ribonuclease R